MRMGVVREDMLRGGKVKTMFEMRGEGRSIREIARELGISRNTVRKYLRHPEIPRARARQPRPSKLQPFEDYIRAQVAEDKDHCVVLLRELRAMGYTGGYTILKDFVKPLRRRRQNNRTMRFETLPGEYAQVDWGLFRYTLPDGRTRRIWAFVMVLSWSRAIFVEFVEHADEATFLRCHIHAFVHFGGIPERILYDNAKVVVLERDDAGNPVWNPRFLDFSLRLGFDARLCAPYRAQTKGRVESGVKYLRRNFWPTVRFTDLADLNRQALAWAVGIADQRIHGTTGERPADRLSIERAHLRPLPEMSRVQPFLRETRKVQRDGFVVWQGSFYGVPVAFAGKTVEIEVQEGTVEIWYGDTRLAVHPQSLTPRQRFVLPGQWAGLSGDASRRTKEPRAAWVPEAVVEQRPLSVYEAVVPS